MNNKGQTLVVFILLIPLLLILGAFIVDNSMIVYKNLELTHITKDIIKSNFTKKDLSEEEIKIIYEKNNITIKNIDISKQDNSLSIKVSYEIESIFGKLINIKNYDISTEITGILEKGRVVFKTE